MRKMSFKRLVYPLLLLMMVASPLHAVRFGVPNAPAYDNKRFHFGFSIGMNFMDFAVKTGPDLGCPGDSVLSVQHAFSPGFAVGVVSDLRMGKHFNLRFIPTFSIGQRNLTYHLAGDAPGVSNPYQLPYVTEKKTVESIMLFLPLEVKWRAARIHNSRPYVTAGCQYTLDMATRKSGKKGEQEDEYRLKLLQHDVGVTVGLGWEFFLPFENKVAVELKMFFGFMDLLQRETNIYTDRISALNSRMLQLSFTFE